MCFIKQLDQQLGEIVKSALASASRLSAQDLHHYSKSFHDVGFIQIPSFVDCDALASVYTCVVSNAPRAFVAYERTERPEVNRHLPGYRFKRAHFEPRGECDISTTKETAWTTISEQLSSTALQLATILKPVIDSLADEFEYKTASMFYYTEGDYLGLHNDAQIYDRINAQLPFSFNTIGCIRILYQERLKVFYDRPGCLNLLGPQTWHDVPPVLRAIDGEDPVRTNLTMRFMR